MSASMEPRIIPSQLPPGLEITIPPGHDLPPQQPSGTYRRKPLPPLPPLRPGFTRQLSAYSVMSAVSDESKTTMNSSRSRSRPRTTPSPSPSAQETSDRLETEISTILIQHTPTPASRRSSVHRSCSPQSRKPEPEIKKLANRRLSTPVSSPLSAHRSSAKIKQITGLDMDYNGITPPRTGRRQSISERIMPSTPVNASSGQDSEKTPSASEPHGKLDIIDDHDDESDFESEWDFSPSSRKNRSSWIPASPVPPRVEILDFDESSPRRRDSEIGPLRSPGMHHFETLPARRNNHMEVSYVGAKDLYHATATSIANSSRRSAPTSSRTSAESTQESILQPKNRLSFAAKVLQSGRKRPPMGINTTPHSPSSLGPGTGPSTGKNSLRSGHPDMHAHSMDDDRLRVKYSDALSRVFRRSGEHRRVVSEGTSPVELPPTSDPRSTTSASGPESPASGLGRKSSRRSMQGLAAQVKKTANSIGLSKDDRRRNSLRHSIRVIPEGTSL
ncbi:hypothetical protein EsH8_I_000972 [Colletotrichum jinshuiense]